MWQYEYSARQAYRMESLFPDDWDRLTRRFEQIPELFQLYDRFKWRDAPGHAPCNAACRSLEICRIRAARSQDSAKCATTWSAVDRASMERLRRHC